MTKTYVITGASSGIGRALVEKLALENIVFAGYRNTAFEAELKLISANVFPFYVDYTKRETIVSACDYIKSKCTKIDTLINAAGCVVAGPMEMIDTDELRHQFNVNVFGHIEFTQNLVDILGNGRVINVSSMASFGNFPFISPYCASKRALDIFFNAFAVENKNNIKVISIKPGVISTPLWEKSIEQNSKYFEKYKTYQNEMDYMVKNAHKNAKNGLSVNKVVETIIKADKSKRPKLSYTVGTDAFFAKCISKLPQSFINTLIKFKLKQIDK